jgi:hypothetical protein
MRVKPEYSPHERRILEALSDGMWHNREELHMLLDDTYSVRYLALNQALCVLNKKLRPKGMMMVCEYSKRRIGRRLVRLISNEE